MSDFAKEWNIYDIYNFAIELNRIESYNNYVDNFLKTYFELSYTTLTHKTDWSNNDVVDINDINRIKNNINMLCQQLDTASTLTTSTQVHQLWTSKKANEIENNLRDLLSQLGNLQFNNNITGLTITNNDIRLNMGE